MCGEQGSLLGKEIFYSHLIILADMPVHCAVCNSSFNGLTALQMHKAAKGHNDPAEGKASAAKILGDPSQTKSNPSDTVPSRKVKSSGDSNFPCRQCGRSFLSRGALTAHAEAKSHSTANAAKVQRSGEAPLRCDTCGRGGFVNHDALNDHKRDSKNHQIESQQEAPQRMSSEPGSRADLGLHLSDGHTSMFLVDKMVQCNLCPCGSLAEEPYESHSIPRLYKQDKMQDTSESIAGNGPYPILAFGHMQSSWIPLSYPSLGTFTDPEERVTETISRERTLARGGDRESVSLEKSSILSSQSFFTQNLPVQYPPNLQIASNLVDVSSSIRPELLKHLGKQWSAISVSEQLLVSNVLRDWCHSVPDLEQNGYRLRQYTRTELLERRRCNTCNSTLSKSSGPFPGGLIHSRTAEQC